MHAQLSNRRGLLLASILGLLCAAPTPAQAKSNARNRYTVVSGDSLWSIAQANGCDVDDLRRANTLGKGPLLVGKTLTIPQCSGKKATPAGKQHRVAAGETLSAIALRYGTTVGHLREANELDSDLIVVGQKLRVAGGSDAITIRVVAGQSRGRPQHGWLAGGVQLPHSPQYFRRRPEWVWGAQHVVDHTRRAIVEVNRKYPKVHRLAIGDISAPKGGPLPGHGSHQSGRDIDIGLYFRSVPAGYPEEFVKADAGTLNAKATWALVHSLYRASKTSSGPDKIFLDYDVQGQLHKAARKAGVSRATLKKVFQYPDGRWAKGRLVQHEPKHDDHLHVRFKCPPRDEHCR